MNFQLILIALTAIAIGVCVGFLIVSLIAIKRQREVVDSMVSAKNLVGCAGIVEVPFNRHQKGKIRLSTRGAVMDLIAVTEEAKQFNSGDRVFIVEVRGNQVLVVSEDSLRIQE